MPPAKLRTIVEELKFATELLHLVRLKIPQVEEFFDGVKWLLARNPKDGKQISNTDVWFIANDYRKQSGELPIVIYYTFDEDIVNLLSIIQSVYPPNEE